MCSEQWAERLGLAGVASEVEGHIWTKAFATALTASAQAAACLYAAACHYVHAPRELRCLSDNGEQAVPTAQVCVTSDTAARDMALEMKTPVLFMSTSTEADAIVRAWGLTRADGLAESSASPVPTAEPQTLVEVFPALRPFIDRQQAQFEIVRCSDLSRESIAASGRTSIRTPFLHENGRIYWVDDGDDSHLLDLLNQDLDLGLGAADLADIVADQGEAKRQKLLGAVREEADAAGKLLRAVGREAIVRHLPIQVMAGVEEERGRLNDGDVARLAESVFGVDLLHVFSAELSEAGLTPPAQWAGSAAARHFVHTIGLPRQYAGFEAPRVDPLLDVDGPAELPPMHGYQEEITNRIRRLLQDGSRKRALLSLPTGSGKTRVAVEALIRAVRDDGLEGPILWTAPTVELCEQAVQTWAYVWRSVGPSRRLHISRLWEAKQAEGISDDGVQVVVATDAKMGYVIDRRDYDWLATASVVVVDEAHGSTETGYTQILHWLGLGREQGKDRCPLLGLTATPFKGMSVEATARLARRYGSRLLDEGIFHDEPYAELQKMGVLARVRQRILAGSVIELTPAEAARARELNRLPPEVEERVGADKSRNRSILDTIVGLPNDWKILVFAASVPHAEQMAAILNFEGVQSAVVQAKTNPGARRHYVQQFNTGSLRVLTNYGVLAEGFDAPSVRAVIMARPTLSPNVYQQMIGRGLRGPLNGGKEECLIVNVQDNILHFGEELAFHHFDYLFDDR